MEELIVSLHMHTTYSDGTGSHQDIANAAINAGVDAVIVTDHNVLVKGPEKYYSSEKKQVLVLTGEEIHDQERYPQKNHLLVLNTSKEFAQLAKDKQLLVDTINKDGGLSFIAHLFDPECPPIKEDDISWIDWDIKGFSGIELWNSLSEIKIRGKTIFHILFYLFFPDFLNIEPPKQHLAKWDELLNLGRKIIAVGGADAHALKVNIGPMVKIVYPYEYHFRGVRNHVLIETAQIGDINIDKEVIYKAIEKGHCFVAYDLPASTSGFSFTAQGKKNTGIMGDEIPLNGGVTFNIKLPQAAECRLLKNGKVIKTWNNNEICSLNANEKGVYRVEVYTIFKGLRRGWIFSNPIFLV
ncbi:MAG: CehA/McbA family metallohydrolase [Chloroflexota bacterium]